MSDPVVVEMAHAPPPQPAAAHAVLELDNITRTFPQGQSELEVFRGASMTIRAGEIVALVGPSGAGKSSLLHIAGLLEQPTSGDVKINGSYCTGLTDAECTRIRREELGFVYQFHHLLPEFSARENVVMPLRIAGVSREIADKRAVELLTMVGLEQRLDHRPGKLSGGEQQRVAIVRALANNPNLLLADEPTGNLDPRTSGKVFDMLIAIVRAKRLAALIATHNLELAAKMDRVILLQDGKLIEGSQIGRS